MAQASYGRYHYTINGKVYGSMREVNEKLKEMKVKPKVFKYEFHRSASKPSVREIRVYRRTRGSGLTGFKIS